MHIRPTANQSFEGIDYDFRVVGSPAELREMIEEKNKLNNRARLVAGYCWKWASKKNPKAYDIQFPDYDFRMKWNLTEDGCTWIISPNSVNEIGCIHTCQGLEVDYIGVIVGEDLVVRNGKVITDVTKRASQDRTVRGYKKQLKEKPVETADMLDRIIKNTYRTLMTRGMKGCYVYCKDKETGKYFTENLKEE